MLATRMRQAASGVSVGGDLQYYLTFNGLTSNASSIICGSDASLDDLHDAAMTVEAWIRPTGLGGGNYGRIAIKGWDMYIRSGGMRAHIPCATTSADAYAASITPDSAWQHVAFTWDDATYDYPRLWKNGTEDTTPVASRDGAIATDAAYDMYIGNLSTTYRAFAGDIAWVRISDTVRWTTGFTPDAKDSPPAVDGNTVEQWNFNEGTGTTAGAEVNGSNDGTISYVSWASF